MRGLDPPARDNGGNSKVSPERRENPERGVAQEERQPECRQNLRQHRPAHHVPDQRQIDADAEHEQSTSRGNTEHRRAPPIQVTTSNATYMPSMTNSPWAKLMKFIMPQIKVRPEENSA